MIRAPENRIKNGTGFKWLVFQDETISNFWTPNFSTIWIYWYIRQHKYILPNNDT